MGKRGWMIGGAVGAALLCAHGWAADTAEAPAPGDPHLVLPAADAKYAAIDGKHLWQYVVEQAGIAERYRDAGHPQFWGRLAGTSGDIEDAQWLLGKYRQIGLANTRLQTIAYFNPQWSAKSWRVMGPAGDRAVTQLTSAEPAYGSPGTDGKELDLEVVYVGLGSEADFAGHDVRGKAVLFVKGEPSYQAGPADILKRAEDHGAAAILSTDLRGGNFSAQSYRAYTHVPTFNLGTRDGEMLRGDIDEHMAPHVQIRMDAEWLPGQKSYLVWGELPGQSDETIYVIAHRDGFFDASGDNASGVASMLGLAEYFARIPQSRRRRTMIFLGTDGHHNIKPGGFGREWLVANRDRFFAKTALMINAEHPAEVLYHGGTAGPTSAGVPLEWYAGGAGRPQLAKLAMDAFREFGVPVWALPSERPPGGDLGRFYWFVPGVVAQSNDFVNMHTAADTPADVTPTGLEAATRAYAKIVDQVNQIALKDLQRPIGADPNAPGTPQGYLSLANCEAWIKDSTANCVQE